MNSATVPTLRIISQATAKAEGYAEITTPIHPSTEAGIFRSVQDGLRGMDAVWIQHKAGCFAAGRKQRDLLPLETLVSADSRRDSNGRDSRQ